jgi:hypothetical protein
MLLKIGVLPRDDGRYPGGLGAGLRLGKRLAFRVLRDHISSGGVLFGLRGGLGTVRPTLGERGGWRQFHPNLARLRAGCLSHATGGTSRCHWECPASQQYHGSLRHGIASAHAQGETVEALRMAVHNLLEAGHGFSHTVMFVNGAGL